MNWTGVMVDNVIYRIGWMLVHTIWQAVLIAAVLAIALRVLPHRVSLSARYLMAYAAMLLVIGAAFFTVAYLTPSAVAPVVLKGNDIGYVGPVVQRDVPPLATEMTQSRELSSLISSERAMPWLVGAWVISVAALGFSQLAGWTILQRWRRAAEPVEKSIQLRLERLAEMMGVRHVLMKLTDRVDVPTLIGIWRPIILAPLSLLNDLSLAQIEAILAHELAHVKRRDYLANLIQVAIETLFFYHPCVWWISRQIRLERECCCDEMASAACGDRAEYVRALAAMEQARGSRLALAITGAGGRSELLIRVRRLLGSSNNRGSSMIHVRSWATTAMLLTILATLAVGSTALRAQQPATQPVPVQPTTVPSAVIRPDDLKADTTSPYQIGADDMVQVSIFDLVAPGVESGKTVRVPANGLIRMPMIDEVNAIGLTTGQLEKTIAEKFRAKSILMNANVSVSVIEARSQVFTINGAVRQPGLYKIPDSRFGLWDALAMAGGAERDAMVRITRSQEGEAQRVIEVPAAAIVSGDSNFNVIIRPRDYVFVIAPSAVAASTTMPTGDPSLSFMRDQDLDERLRVLSRAYTEAQIATLTAATKFTPQHPTVVQARKTEESLYRLYRDTLKEASSRRSPAGSPPPVTRSAVPLSIDEENLRLVQARYTEQELKVIGLKASLRPDHPDIQVASQNLEELRKLRDDLLERLKKQAS